MSVTSLLSKKLLPILVFSCGLAFSSGAAAEVKIAVTDLSYQEQVARYFNETSFKYKGKGESSNSDSYNDSGYRASARSNNRSKAEVEMEYSNRQGTEIVIDRGELRKFTGDIKGGLIKAGFRVMQGKPWTSQNTETLYDIIDRIKKGFYPGAEYVLFGTISGVDYRNDLNSIQGSNATNVSRNLELVAEFSLINTKTYEVMAAFSAIGEGSESKLLTGQDATNFSPSKARIMKEVTETLGEDVVKNILEQFPEGASPGRNAASRVQVSTETEVEVKKPTVREYR